MFMISIAELQKFCCYLQKSLRAMYHWDCLDGGFYPIYKYTKLSLSDIDNTILERTKAVTTLNGTLHSSKCSRLLAGVWHSSSLDQTEASYKSHIAQ